MGYKMAGFKELLAVEWDQNAVDTFRLNFPEVPVYHGDIAKLTGAECMRLAGVGVGKLDVFDGSPPCQGFSTAGKRKFDDPRNSLFKEYARLIQELQPRVFVMENVTGMVKGYMKQAYLTIIHTLRDCGYRAKGEVLNAMYYNVPQSRERVIIIGVRNDLGIEPTHPKPQKRPIPVRTAMVPCVDIPSWQMDVANNTKNYAVGKELLKLKEGENLYNLSRLDRNKPCPTICKRGGNHVRCLSHWTECRVMTPAELSRLASFPDEFLWIKKGRHDSDAFENVWARIGNCVPPNLMRAIATHIKENILTHA